MGGWRWLQPGLHLKRWVLAISAGIILLILGAMSVALGIFNPPTPDGSAVPLNPYVLGGTLVTVGTVLVFSGVYRLVRRIEKLLKREGESRGLTEIAYQHTRLARGPKTVCLGGGTGLSTLLSGLKEHTSDITAVVSVADDGGSSGRLRLDFDMLPPGDIRNCLIALADAGPVMAELMQYRFEEGEFTGHSFGNLFIAVLARIRGDFGSAVREANRILSVRGRVLAATLDKISLVATHSDGTKTTGQRHIAQAGKPIEGLELKPAPGEASPDVLEAMATAELILIGPGSLYTSVLPPLLEPSLVEAINRSHALVVFVVNTMGQVGETAGFTVSQHLQALRKHAPGLRVDRVLANDYRPSAARLTELETQGVRLTEYDRKGVTEFGVRAVLRDVIDADHPTRHHPQKLAAAILEVWTQSRGRNP
jgi:uncharacterized cofD-like protein